MREGDQFLKTRYWKLLFIFLLFILPNGCESKPKVMMTEVSIPTKNPTLSAILAPTITPPTISLEAILSPKQVEIKSGIEIGNKIIYSLGNFYREYGYYPENLSELVPAYIEKIPLTTTGSGFYYVKYSDDLNFGPYILSFTCESVPFVGCTYHAKLSNWECTYFPPE